MRNFIETDTHIQCCYPRCKKMMKKSKKDKDFQEACMRLGNFAKVCKKHEKLIGRRAAAEC